MSVYVRCSVCSPADIHVYNWTCMSRASSPYVYVRSYRGCPKTFVRLSPMGIPWTVHDKSSLNCYRNKFTSSMFAHLESEIPWRLLLKTRNTYYGTWCRLFERWLRTSCVYFVKFLDLNPYPSMYEKYRQRIILYHPCIHTYVIPGHPVYKFHSRDFSVRFDAPPAEKRNARSFGAQPSSQIKREFRESGSRTKVTGI